MDDETLDSLIRRVYATALKASHESACVAIHVGQEVWDAFKARVEREGYPAPGVTVARMFGFPIVLEPQGRPDHVSVRVTTVIQ